MPLWCGENNQFYLNYDVEGPLCHCGAVKTIIFTSTMMLQTLYAIVVLWKLSSLNYDVARPLCHCGAVKTIISTPTMM